MGPFIIPVFLPGAGCPHKCVFCDQAAITGVKGNVNPLEELRASTGRFFSFKRKKKRLSQISFYGGNFLGQRAGTIRSLLNESAKLVKAGKIDSVRFSTRPDTINDNILDMLERHPIRTIELGVQSMDNHVLSMSRRGHSSSETEKAARLLKKRGYETVAQLMIGLPGDTRKKAILSAQKVVDLSFDFVRIYPTIVFKNSPLASWHINGKYAPRSLDQSVSLAGDMWLLFNRNGIPVIRMGLQAGEGLDDTILAGPYHPAFGHLALSKIFLEKAASAIESTGNISETPILRVNPKSASKLAGMNRGNISELKKRFELKSVKIITDSSLGKDVVEVCV